jgi:hypothetical protein
VAPGARAPDAPEATAPEATVSERRGTAAVRTVPAGGVIRVEDAPPSQLGSPRSAKTAAHTATHAPPAAAWERRVAEP